MIDDSSQLEDACRRAAKDFLALEWESATPEVRAAVEELLRDSKQYTTAMGFLLTQCARLPVQAEPARRLNEFVRAVSALRALRRRAEYLSVELSLHGAA